MVSENKATIISTVGQRALAVIMPIRAIITSHLKNKDVEVILLVTKNTISIGDLCKEWLTKEFPTIKVPAPLFFEVNNEFTELLIKDKPNIYFNTNPAMRWEISYLCLSMPDNTVCFSSDYEYCYIWNITEDIATSKKIEIKDIGMESYFKLNNTLSMKENNKQNDSLSSEIRKCLIDLDLIKSFVIAKKDILIDPFLHRINQRLIWIKERRGNLHLLFDFVHDVDGSNLLSDFRLITVVFDHINYTVTIVSGNKNIIERAKVEGIEYIKVGRSDSWHNDLSDWISGRLRIQPKKIIPDSLQTFNIRILSAKRMSKTKALCVCLGDNIEPTLKAILSHQDIRDIYLFIDESSPKIKYLADNLLKQFINRKKIMKVPTDHKGTGIVDKISEIIKNGVDCIFNITPGTKDQIVGFTVAAKVNNMKEKVYSIYRGNSKGKETVRCVLNSSDICEVVFPDIQDIINCHIAPFRPHDGKNKLLRYDLWDILLAKIVDGSILPSSEIKKIKYSDKRPVFTILNGDKIKMNCKNYSLNKGFFAKGGTWWEAVVAKAVSNNLGVDVLWQATWEWIDNKDPYTEIDVIATYRNHIIAVSCKTTTSKYKYVADAALMIKSESSKRFGRFAIPFVAIPYEKAGEKKMANVTIEECKVLTPQILNSQAKLRECIDTFIDRELSTTKSDRKT